METLIKTIAEKHFAALTTYAQSCCAEPTEI